MLNRVVLAQNIVITSNTSSTTRDPLRASWGAMLNDFVTMIFRLSARVPIIVNLAAQR